MRAFGRFVCSILAAATMLIPAIIDGQAAGAFAVGNCGAYGFAYDYPEAETARQAAISEWGGGCKALPGEGVGAAFAVGAGSGGGRHGYARGPKLGGAQNTALKQCHSFGGKDCMIRAWICDAKGG